MCEEEVGFEVGDKGENTVDGVGGLSLASVGFVEVMKVDGEDAIEFLREIDVVVARGEPFVEVEYCAEILFVGAGCVGCVDEEQATSLWVATGHLLD